MVVLAAAVAAAFGVAASAAPGAALHKCKPGFKHAIIGGKHACLKVGVPCQRKFDAQYHRHGFHCHGARLTRAAAAPPLAPPPNADLALTVVDAPDPVKVGNELTYTLTVTNAGPAPAPRVVTATEQLANHVLAGTLRFVRADPGCGESYGVLQCVFTNVAAGSTVTASIVVVPTAAGTYSAPWHVTPADHLRTQDTNTANNHVTVSTLVEP